MKLPICEMFVSVQGEGVFTGVPSFFIRTSGCNLRCCFKGSICDTPYSSYNPEKSIYETLEGAVEEFNKLREQNPNVNHLVITGGEPLLFQKALGEFLNMIGDDLIITIETNGSLPMLHHDKITLYSVSPKLSTSVGDAGGILTKDQVDQHNKNRINIQNLCEYALDSENVQFKFVYSGKECVEEIESIYKEMGLYVQSNMPDRCEEYVHYCNPYYKTLLMPEGITNEQLSNSAAEAVKVCIEKGWQFCDRMHIRVFGDKRGV